MTPTNSYAADGMILCAMNDPSGRRGIWVRFPNEPEAATTVVKPTVVEIFAGREGDDVQLRLSLGDVLTGEELDKLARCLLVGAANCEDFVEDPETGGLYPPDRVPTNVLALAERIKNAEREIAVMRRMVEIAEQTAANTFAESWRTAMRAADAEARAQEVTSIGRAVRNDLRSENERMRKCLDWIRDNSSDGNARKCAEEWRL